MSGAQLAHGTIDRVIDRLFLHKLNKAIKLAHTGLVSYFGKGVQQPISGSPYANTTFNVPG